MSSFSKNPKSLISEPIISIPTAKVGDIIGERISYNSNGQLSFNELSTLSKTLEMYSDKRYETARYLFVQKGEIVRHIAVSSRVPSSTVIKPDEDFLFNLRTFAEKSDSQVVFVHNHPSGLITPSEPDISLTKMLEKHFVDTENVSRFAGHIILDHGSYGLYTPAEGWKALIDGEFKEITEVSDIRHIQPSQFGMKVTGDLDLITLAEKAKTLDAGNAWNKELWIPAFFCTVHGIIQSHDYIHIMEFQESNALAEKLKFIGRDAGCENVYLFPQNKKQHLICEAFAQETGMIKDVYYEDEQGYELSDYSGGTLFHTLKAADIVVEDTADAINTLKENTTGDIMMNKEKTEVDSGEFMPENEQEMEFYDFEHDIAFTDNRPILTVLGSLNKNPEEPIEIPSFKMLDKDGKIYTFDNMEIVDFDPESHKIKMINKDNTFSMIVNQEILLDNLKETKVVEDLAGIILGETKIPNYVINENLSFKNMVISAYDNKSQKYTLKASDNTEILITENYFKNLLKENVIELTKDPEIQLEQETPIEMKESMPKPQESEKIEIPNSSSLESKIESLMDTVDILMKKLERAEEEKNALYKKIAVLEDQTQKNDIDRDKVAEHDELDTEGVGEPDGASYATKKKFSRDTAFSPNIIVPKFGHFDENTKEIEIYDNCRFSKYIENKDQPWKSKVLLEMEMADGSHKPVTIPAETYQRIINATETLEARKNSIENPASWDWMKIHQDYREAMKIDKNEVRINTAHNFIHNYRVMCNLQRCANLDDAMKVASHIVDKMQPAERQKFNAMRLKAGAAQFDALLREEFVDHTKVLDKEDLMKAGTKVDPEMEEINRDYLYLAKGDTIGNTNTRVGDKIPMALHTRGFDGKMRKTPKAEFEIISVSKNFGRSMAVLYSAEAKSRYTIPTDMLVAHINKIEREKFKEEKRQIKKDHKIFGFYEGR